MTARLYPRENSFYGCRSISAPDGENNKFRGSEVRSFITDGGDFVMNYIDVLMFQMFVACYYRQCKPCEKNLRKIG